MPHIKVQMYSGRTEETKQKLVEAITADISRILDVDDRSISIAIEEVSKEDWFEKIYDKCIVEDFNLLHKKPGYGSLADEEI